MKAARRKRSGFGLTVFGAWTVLLFLVLPVVVVIPVSFTPERYLSMPGATLSLRHYETLLTDPSWLDSIRDSVIVASFATLGAVAFGTFCAIGCWRVSTRLSDAVRMLMLAPIIVPAIVHALGFYRAWVEFGLIDTYLGLIIAHALKGMPYVIISVSAALANFDLKLEQAARNLGATLPQTLRLIVLPSVMPGILAGAVFAFVLSWDELIVNLFITSRDVYTLPRRIWDGIQNNINPAVAAIATVLMLLTLAAMITHFLLRRRSVESAGRAEP